MKPVGMSGAAAVADGGVAGTPAVGTVTSGTATAAVARDALFFASACEYW